MSQQSVVIYANEIQYPTEIINFLNGKAQFYIPNPWFTPEGTSSKITEQNFLSLKPQNTQSGAQAKMAVLDTPYIHARMEGTSHFNSNFQIAMANIVNRQRTNMSYYIRPPLADSKWEEGRRIKVSVSTNKDVANIEVFRRVAKLDHLLSAVMELILVCKLYEINPIKLRANKVPADTPNENKNMLFYKALIQEIFAYHTKAGSSTQTINRLKGKIEDPKAIAAFETYVTSLSGDELPVVCKSLDGKKVIMTESLTDIPVDESDASMVSLCKYIYSDITVAISALLNKFSTQTQHNVIPNIRLSGYTRKNDNVVTSTIGSSLVIYYEDPPLAKAPKTDGGASTPKGGKPSNEKKGEFPTRLYTKRVVGKGSVELMKHAMAKQLFETPAYTGVMFIAPALNFKWYGVNSTLSVEWRIDKLAIKRDQTDYNTSYDDGNDIYDDETSCESQLSSVNTVEPTEVREQVISNAPPADSF